MPEVDGHAFAALYEEFAPYVGRLARRFAKCDTDIAKDFAQEAWLALLLTPETRWRDVPYVRTVIFRAMVRWRAQELAEGAVGTRQCAIAGQEHEQRRRGRERGRTVREDGRSERDRFRFRRHVPRPLVTSKIPPRAHAA